MVFPFLRLLAVGVLLPLVLASAFHAQQEASPRPETQQKKPCIVFVYFESEQHESLVDAWGEVITSAPTDENGVVIWDDEFSKKLDIPLGAREFEEREFKALVELMERLKKIAERENIHINFGKDTALDKALDRLFSPDPGAAMRHRRAARTQDADVSDVSVKVHVFNSSESINSFRSIEYKFRNQRFFAFTSSARLPELEDTKAGSFPSVEDVMKAVRRWRQAHDSQ